MHANGRKNANGTGDAAPERLATISPAQSLHQCVPVSGAFAFFAAISVYLR
jgi:hypothetical protein